MTIRLTLSFPLSVKFKSVQSESALVGSGFEQYWRIRFFSVPERLGTTAAIVVVFVVGAFVVVVVLVVVEVDDVVVDEVVGRGDMLPLGDQLVKEVCIFGWIQSM